MKIHFKMDNSEIINLLLDIKAQVSTLSQMMLIENNEAEFNRIFHKRRLEFFLDLLKASPRLFDNPDELQHQIEEELKKL